HPGCVSSLLRLRRFPALTSAVFYIRSAVLAIHIGQSSLSPPGIKREDALFGFAFTRVARSNVSQIDRQNVRDQDFRGMTTTGSVRLIFFGEVLAEGALRPCA